MSEKRDVTARGFPKWKQRLLIRLLDGFRRALESEGKEAASDHVAETMDQVVGWCSPHMRLTNFLGHAPSKKRTVQGRG